MLGNPLFAGLRTTFEQGGVPIIWSSHPFASQVIFISAVEISSLITTIATWFVFKKARKPGWAAVVPVYNYFVMLDIIGRPRWWAIVLVLTPLPVGGAAAILLFNCVIYTDLAKSFGKSWNYMLLLACLPFIGFPMLALGKARYRGPAALRD